MARWRVCFEWFQWWQAWLKEVRIEDRSWWVSSCGDLRGNGSKPSIQQLKIGDFVKHDGKVLPHLNIRSIRIIFPNNNYNNNPILVAY